MTEINDGEDTKKSGDESLLDEAKRRFKICVDAETESRALEVDDIKFSAGEQWDARQLVDRREDGRPCLVINRIPQIINQITNDQRQNRPSIKVFPVDEFSDVETAKKQQGLIRHIEYNSNAEVAYDTAFDSAVRAGLGYFRIIPDYVDGNSFDQELLIRPIPNRFSVYLDPHSKETDGSDAEYGFVVDYLSKDEFKRLYPEARICKMEDWASLSSNTDGWVEKDSARIAEYLFKDYEQVTICRLSDGYIGEKKTIPDELPPGVTIEQERTVQKPFIRWVKINGVEKLEETRIDISWVPILPVYGTVLNIEGKRHVSGIVRDAKDPQRMVNYMTSNEAEAIALAPRAPWIVSAGSLEGHEDKWESANRKNHAYLEYNSTDLNGNPAQAPTRVQFEPAVQAITQAKMIAGDDLKSVTGIHDATLGNRSNETSGIAIQRRNAQAQTSNFHYIDNLSRTMRHAGRILVAWIPKVYDSARAVRIIGEEGDQEIVKVNQQIVGPDGKPVLYDLTSGKYDVIVETGPSYATKRQEAAENMLGMVKANPQLMQVIGDLVWKNFDFPGAHEAAERIKKTIPPNLLEDKKKTQIPPEAEAQMQQMGQMIEQLTKQANEQAKVIEMDLLKIESTERIKMRELEVKAEIELAKLGSQSSLKMLEHEIAELNARGQQLGSEEPIPENLNGAGPQGFAPNEQQPTGGQSPASMGENL